MKFGIKARRTFQFFDDAVTDKIGADKAKGLTRAGALTRTIAKRSLRQAPRLSYGQLNRQQRAIYDRKLKAWERGKRKLRGKKPKLPHATAKPGKPPFNKTGKVKDRILFGFQATEESVVAGPTEAGQRSVEVLEKGGSKVLKGYRGRKYRMTFDPHPFMQPAFEEVLPQFPSFFKIV